MVLTKYWVMAKKFDGFPKLSDFKIVEEELPELKEGGHVILIFFQIFHGHVILILKENLICVFCRISSQFYFFISEFLCEAVWLSVDPYNRYGILFSDLIKFMFRIYL